MGAQRAEVSNFSFSPTCAHANLIYLRMRAIILQYYQCLSVRSGCIREKQSLL